MKIAFRLKTLFYSKEQQKQNSCICPLLAAPLLAVYHDGQPAQARDHVLVGNSFATAQGWRRSKAPWQTAGLKRQEGGRHIKISKMSHGVIKSEGQNTIKDMLPLVYYRLEVRI